MLLVPISGTSQGPGPFSLKGQYCSRKSFWVDFAPQFHAHLVKCTVVLVPGPIQKVKKVLFVYILELLNEEGS
jgi:hypothetical protein